MPKPTVLRPSFSNPGSKKVNEAIDVPSPHVLVRNEGSNYRSAIAAHVFPRDRDGTYVFITRIDKIVDGSITIGFTATGACGEGSSEG